MISFTRVNLFFENKFLNFKICTAYFKKKFLKFEIRTGRRKFILHIADSLHPGSKVDFKHPVSFFFKIEKSATEILFDDRQICFETKSFQHRNVFLQRG